MPIENIHIASQLPLATPRQVMADLPRTDQATDTVESARAAVKAILNRSDRRHLLIVGPCSLHCESDALEYARRLKALADDVSDRLLLVMRAYFEKPRTTKGWKGMIYDPDLDDTYDIEKGLRLARKILLGINSLGLPAATEMLNPVTPQYTADLIAWAAIGARTAESQTHRQLASGVSMPVGFKNATDGCIQIAIDAVLTAARSHSFLGVTDEGNTAIFNTTGNPNCHVVLRGGGGCRFNYRSEHIAYSRELMKRAGIKPNIMVDCSHANSGKQHDKQIDVMDDVLDQIVDGERDIVGTMLESNLKAGRQDITGDLLPGVSITDSCLGWDKTEALIRKMRQTLR
jgi:3-deoxy-7-phosphoheptulonate synthase